MWDTWVKDSWLSLHRPRDSPSRSPPSVFLCAGAQSALARLTERARYSWFPIRSCSSISSFHRLLKGQVLVNSVVHLRYYMENKLWCQDQKQGYQLGGHFNYPSNNAGGMEVVAESGISGGICRLLELDLKTVQNLCWPDSSRPPAWPANSPVAVGLQGLGHDILQALQHVPLPMSPANS